LSRFSLQLLKKRVIQRFVTAIGKFFGIRPISAQKPRDLIKKSKVNTGLVSFDFATREARRGFFARQNRSRCFGSKNSRGKKSGVDLNEKRPESLVLGPVGYAKQWSAF